MPGPDLNAKAYYVYTDDDGTEMLVRMSAGRAQFDGFALPNANQTLPMWPRPARWIRHVGVKGEDGKTRQYPCKNTQGKYKQVGTGGHAYVVHGVSHANGTIVGRTGERGGS